MINIRIGGVPEHFNLPWLLAIEGGAAARLGGAAEWREFPGGTGAMAAALREREIDAALLLTEGAVAAIANAGGFRIASWYTESPLLWGIHVPARSKLERVRDLEGHRYAISRRGSGSHLMACVHARAQGWTPDSLEFVVVGDLDGAVRAFEDRQAEIFFWEKFMTKPLVDAGRFRRIGEFAAPWPAFVLCAAEELDRRERGALAAWLGAALEAAAALLRRADSAALIAQRYGLMETDVAEWLEVTRWALEPGVAPRSLEPVARSLAELSLIPPSFRVEEAVRTLEVP
jgi:ABC-type nitrate/sulfonate/bicarbonate transport system substrate-binding protein